MIGMTCLSIYLSLTARNALGVPLHAIAPLLPVLALIAGILLLVGR